MILPDDEDGSSKLKSVEAPTLRLPERAAYGSASHLPDYETSQAQQVETPAPVVSKGPKDVPHRFDPRIWRAVLIALGIYVFLTIIIGTPLFLTLKNRKQVNPPPFKNLYLGDSIPAPPLDFALGLNGVPKTGNNCIALPAAAFDGLVYSTSFETLLSFRGALSIRSNVTDDNPTHSKWKGIHTLTVESSDDLVGTQTLLSFSVNTSDPSYLDMVHLCLNTGWPGIYLYYPEGIDVDDMLSFDIRLTVPRRSNPLSDVSTFLPMFQQTFGGGLAFQTINLAGSGSHISCDTLQAKMIAVKTSFASISGTFLVSESLRVENVEGPININATLLDAGESDRFTYLSIENGNSSIVANVTLESSGPDPAKYYASVKTYNAPLTLHVRHENNTPSSMLALDVQNSQAPTAVTVDSKFSGFYDIHTQASWAQVNRGSSLQDPTGKSRLYIPQVFAKSWSTSRGWLGWNPHSSPPDPSAGHVEIGSSLGPISLNVDN